MDVVISKLEEAFTKIDLLGFTPKMRFIQLGLVIEWLKPYRDIRTHLQQFAWLCQQKEESRLKATYMEYQSCKQNKTYFHGELVLIFSLMPLTYITTTSFPRKVALFVIVERKWCCMACGNVLMLKASGRVWTFLDIAIGNHSIIL